MSIKKTRRTGFSPAGGLHAPSEAPNPKFFSKKGLQGFGTTYILCILTCGRSSVVEHHVANVGVVSSSLIARSWEFCSHGWEYTGCVVVHPGFL